MITAEEMERIGYDKYTALLRGEPIIYFEYRAIFRHDCIEMQAKLPVEDADPKWANMNADLAAIFSEEIGHVSEGTSRVLACCGVGAVVSECRCQFHLLDNGDTQWEIRWTALVQTPELIEKFGIAGFRMLNLLAQDAEP